MSLTKLLLSALGTIGLTAGTLLAMAEPSAGPLPHAIPATGKSTCPGKACSTTAAAACVDSKCQTNSVIPVAFTAASNEAGDCAAGSCPGAASTKVACETSKCEAGKCNGESCKGACQGEAYTTACREPVAANSETSCSENRCDVAATAGACHESDDAQVFFGTGVLSNSGVKGTIVLVAGVSSDGCTNGSCTEKDENCRGHEVHAVELGKDGEPRVLTRRVFIKNCHHCRDACESDANITCESSRTLPVAACTATPACVTTSKASECDRCDRSSCDNESCCRSADGGLPSIHAAPPRPADRQPTAHYNERAGAPSRFGFGLSGIELDEEQPAGVVRLTHIATATDESRDLHFVPDVQYFPTGSEFNPMRHRIRLSGFAAPVAAPHPHAAAAPRPASHEGTWTRQNGPCTITFECEQGHFQVTCRFSGTSTEFRLGGLCHATPDGQLYGVIEHAECTDDDDIENHAFAVRLIDQPFSIRFRAEGDRLFVKQIRCAGISPTFDDSDSNDLFEQCQLFGCGRYTRTDAE